MKNYLFNRAGEHVVRACPVQGTLRLASEAVAGAANRYRGASVLECQETRIVFHVSEANIAAAATISAGRSGSKLGAERKSKVKVEKTYKSKRILSSCYYPDFSSCSSDQENIIKTSWNCECD